MIKNFLLIIAGIIFLGILFRSFGSKKSSVIVANSEEKVISSPSLSPTTIPKISHSDEVQVIKGVYEEEGFSPYRFKVKAGIPVRLEVLAKIDGFGCMGSIMIPDLSEDIQGFKAGQTNIFEVTPPTPGEYLVTCAMGIPHAVIEAI